MKRKRSSLRSLKIVVYLILLGFILFSVNQFFLIRNESEEGLNDAVGVLIVGLEDRMSTIDKLYYTLELAIEGDLIVKTKQLKSLYDQGQLTADHLETIKGDQEHIDLYVIDQNDQIILTTSDTDLGLDFQAIASSNFLNFLESIRQEKSFVTDRISLSTLNSDIRKYGYLASDDGKYIFEASYDMSEFHDLLDNDSFETFSSKASQHYDFIERLTIFNQHGNSFDRNVSIYDADDPQMIEAFRIALASREQSSYTVSEGIYQTTHLFIPYIIPKNKEQDQRYILALSYTNQPVVEEIYPWALRQFGVFILFAILYALLLRYYNRRLLQPISDLLEAFDQVEEKDLSIRLSLSNSGELSTAFSGFNEMTESLENLIASKEKNESNLSTLLAKNKVGYFETVRALANATDAKDDYTGSHCERVMNMSLMLGQHLQLSESQLETIRFGSLLHDIGKIGIHDSVLNKQSKFTPEEYAIMQTHPQVGYDIVKNIEFLHAASEIILSHHERIDGQGYPNGLEGDQIPYLAKILAITDAFDAMTSKRVYKSHVMTVREAFRELRCGAGSHFDAALVEQFIDAYTLHYGEDLDYIASVIEMRKQWAS